MRFQPIKFLWASYKKSLIGIALAGAIGGTLSALLISVPTGRIVTGTLLSLGLSETKIGSRMVGEVRIRDKTVLVRIPRRQPPCPAGTNVLLEEKIGLLGYSYVLVPQPKCALNVDN